MSLSPLLPAIRLQRVAGLAAAILMVAVAATPVFPAESKITIPGNHPEEAAELTTGEMASDRQLRITITLALHNREQLEELIAQQQDPSSPEYHRWLTPAEFNDRFGPTPDDRAVVEQWLTSSGLSVVSVGGAGREVVATGAAATVEKAFAVKIAISADGGTYANLNDPEVPASVAPLIGSVRGLGNTLRFKNNLVTVANKVSPQATEGGVTAFGPKDLWTFYDETGLNNAGTTGAGADCIALVETADFEDDAVALFDATFGLPGTTFSRVLADGTNPGVGPPQAQSESDLDVEYSHATAPGAPITAYLGTGANATVDALARAVNDNTCGAISLSFEFCGAGASFFSGTLDPILAQAEAQGQAVFAATGDEGAAGLKATSSGCVVAGGAPKVSELAADPHVTAVGGTQFTPTFDSSGNDVGYATESVWHDKAPIPKSERGASGGGRSSVFAKPSFQSGVFPKDKRRDIPDISLGASAFNPGFFFAVGTPGQLGIVGGTSLATPVWAGISALAAQSAGTTRVGNINAKLYALGPLNNPASSGLHDVTTGNNSFDGVAGYSAKPGYDRATGWGTPDIGILVPMLGP
jgi:subtilase family serine protease